MKNLKTFEQFINEDSAEGLRLTENLKDTLKYWEDRKRSKINLKAAHLSSEEYKKAKKLKDFDKGDWEWNSKSGLYDRVNESKLNEGQFSWMTQDTGQQIGSERQNRITVYMYDNKGNSWEEKGYDGYGEFGGKDFYDLVSTMNGYPEDRQTGIDLAFEKIKTKDKGRKTLFPALVTNKRYNWKNHDFTTEPDNDPNQSWWFDEEEYNY